MLTTSESIRTLQRKLYRKTKQEPACRFHALYDKISRADILSHAYNLVRANKGSTGIDGVTFEEIEAGEGAPAFVAELAEALKGKSYKPDPVKRVMLPKCKGRHRPGVTCRSVTKSEIASRGIPGLLAGIYTLSMDSKRCRQ